MSSKKDNDKFTLFELKCESKDNDDVVTHYDGRFEIMNLKNICIGLFLILTLVAGFMFGMPQYRVWQQAKEGEAALAKAEQDRQIAVQEAKAKEESAKSLANAEVIRAEGIAKANKIIGDSLQNNDAYIHYLWIEAIKESKSDVIYVPTEAGIPITESGRFLRKEVENTK